MFRSVASVADQAIPDLRAAEDHGEEIRAILSAGGRGGAILGALLGAALGIEAGSITWFVLGILVGSLGGAVVCLAGLLMFLLMFFVCERAVLWYMAASSSPIRPRLAEPPYLPEDTDATPTAIRDHPARR